MQKDKNKSTKLKKTSEKGITMIALVITIVVIIILAGITIDISIGNKGVIKEARDTQENIEQAQQEGIQQLENLKEEETTIEDGIQQVEDTTSPIINEMNILGITKNSLKIVVDITEKESGIASIEYIITEGENEETSGEIQEKTYKFETLKSKTEYEIKVIVKDIAGNYSEMTKNVTTL